jgi:hypothetical protein
MVCLDYSTSFRDVCGTSVYDQRKLIGPPAPHRILQCRRRRFQLHTEQFAVEDQTKPFYYVAIEDALEKEVIPEVHIELTHL